MRLCILLCTSLLAVATAQNPPVPQCGGSWQQLNDKCFLVVSSFSTWGTAQKRCQKKGGNLAIIPDAATTTFLKNVLTGVGGQFWIGLHDVIAENTFKWIDGTPITSSSYTNWNPGEPNNSGNEDCVTMYASSAKWNDDSCSKTKYYICSRSSNVSPVCDEADGWTNYNGKCYQFFNRGVTWQGAENTCKYFKGGHITSVKSAADQKYLDNLQAAHTSDYWIGLQDKENGNDGEYQWSDKTTFDPNMFSKWDANQPTNQWYGKEGDCGVVNSTGVWTIDQCSGTRPFVCSIAEGTCPVGWHLSGGMCYQSNADPNNLLTWTDAKAFCSAQGAYLTPIKSDVENNFLKTFLKDMNSNGIQYMFFGLSDLGSDGTYKWAVDGTNLGNGYQHWEKAQPPFMNGQKDCAYIPTGDFQDARWKVGDCYQLGGFVCRIMQGTALKYVPPGPVTNYCDEPDWDVYSDQCYKIFLTKKTWTDAEKACQNENGYLVSVPDDGVQSFMSGRINVVKFRVWLGLNDRASETNFKWSDSAKTPLGTYNNWAPGYPDAADCVSMVGWTTNYGLWKTRTCTELNYYACQKQAKSGAGPTSIPKPTAGIYDRCGNGWEYDKKSDKCFVFRPTAYENWFNARYKCRQEGGDLISFQGNDDLKYAAGRLKSYGSGLSWTGCNDLGIEGGWIWSDKKPFSIINWAPGQPNNLDYYYSGGQHCCQIYNYWGDWNDHDCYLSYGYSCSRDEYIFKYFITYTEKKFDANVDLMLVDKWPRECAERCVQEKSFTCLSFDYDRAGRTCFLRKLAKTPGSLLPTFDSQHFDHYERDQSVQPPLPPTQPPSTMGCPKDWTRYQDYCYYVSFVKDDFDGAEQACPNGAMLASVVDRNVNHFLQALVYEKNQKETSCWIGLNDRAQEMLYQWSNGETVTFTNWNAHEPNNVNGEDCIELYIHSGYWNDLPCKGYDRSSLCRQGLSTGNPPPPVDGKCPIGWVSWMNRCYLLSKDKASWADASTNCKKTSGAQLVVIEERLEEAFLSGQLGMEASDEFFIALSDSKTAGLYEWMDGFPITYTNWGEGQPDDRTGHCVTMSSGKDAGYWADRDCSQQYRYICEKAKAGEPPIQPPPVNPPTTPSSQDCASGWTGYGQRCFKAVEFDQGSDAADWDEANRVCTNFGGHLASFHHPDEEAFLVKNLKLNLKRRFWIGLNDQRNEGGYRWSDGTPVQYTNWAPGEPNDYGGQEECVETDLKGGKWNDLFCWYKRNYLCSIPKGTPVVTTPAPTPPPGGDCYGDNNWFHLAPYCYYFTSHWDDWHSANHYCHEMDAHLVSIHSDDERDFINKRLNDENGYWNGLKSNLTHPINHEWEDHSPYDYQNWLDKPDAGYGDKLCVKIISEDSAKKGKWMSYNCGEYGPYICKKRFDGLPATHAPTNPPSGKCQPGWKQLSDRRCYKMMGMGSQSDPKKNWRDAKKACEDSGALFASVHSYEVHNVLTADMINADGDVWIGMSNIENQGTYVWADSSSKDVLVWAYNQPYYSENITEGCACMKHEDVESGRWFAEDCSLLHSYICRREPDDSISGTPPPPPSCSDINPNLADYTKYGDACFKVDLSQKRTFDGAKAYCDSDGATLASVRNGFEQSQLVTMAMEADDNVWIGLYDDPATRLFTWLDGWPFLIEFWGWNDPRGNNCTALTKNDYYFYISGSWENVDCSEKYYTACKYTTGSPPPTPGPEPGFCEEEWAEYGGSCYILGTGSYELATFKDAVYDCDRYYGGAYVATISNQGENQFVQNLAQKGVPGISWILIGLERGPNGGWKWVDDSTVAYQNWAGNVYGDETSSCVEIRTSAKGKWDTIACDIKSHFVCEKPKTRITSTEAPFKPKDCVNQFIVSGWKQLDTFCYLHVSDSVSWEEAEADCNTKGGYLVSVHTDAEQYFVKKLGEDNFAYVQWIGLHEVSELGLGTDYGWTDGTDVDYPGWDHGQPNDQQDTATCVRMRWNGKWENSNCGKSLAYTCKRKFDSKTPVVKPTKPPKQGNCPKDWLKVGKACYQFRSGSKTWNESRNDCLKEEGGDLAAIHNQLTQSFLTTALKGQPSNMWIGLRRTFYDFSFLWVDQSKRMYTHWANNQPDGFFGEEACVVMAKDPDFPGRWNDIDCSEKHGYLCYKPLDPSLPTSIPPDVGKCPLEDYMPYGEDCFKINMTMLNFGNATVTCSNEGAALATIIDGYAEAFVMYNMLNQDGPPPDSIWIGFSADVDTRQFRWADGWPVTYTNWGWSQPMEENGLCTMLTQNTDWETSDCGVKMPFVCRTTTATPLRPTNPSLPGTCPDGWLPFHDHCYQFNTSSLGYESWYQAKHQCEKDHNGRLLSVHTQAENNFVQKTFRPENSYEWSGIWLDLSREPVGGGHYEFSWNDGHAIDYTNWATGEPAENEWNDCAVLMPKAYGKWETLSCSYGAFFVCYKEQDVAKPSPQKGLSGGAIAGIIIGVLLLVILVLGIGYFFMKNRQPKGLIEDPGLPSSTSFDNVLYTPSLEEVKPNPEVSSGTMSDA
ncbi:lymphocyte antigen 75-like [Acanthaster planci]|uniref:Lymphocyte antigen 75-like n=1 Tax=Acanthaster planci TaxID=133434 RepID=A0A8B7YA40_ACAPL|nr:lymphocyte antigen 75-like [Acanthaster planci]